jgi:hypothetical protein
MSWIKPAAKNALKYAPHAQEAWKHAGKPAKEAASKALDDRRNLRNALAHAETLDGGTILRAFDPASKAKVWVVFSGEVPVAAHPKPSVSLEQLLAGADLTKRRTPECFRQERQERSLRRRAKRSVGALKKARRNGDQRHEPGTP